MERPWTPTYADLLAVLDILITILADQRINLTQGERMTLMRAIQISESAKSEGK